MQISAFEVLFLGEKLCTMNANGLPLLLSGTWCLVIFLS